MNANKQDAGGEVTNPDNVGGLLPCPFCGGEAELVGGEQDEFCHWHVQCTVCGAISGESLAPSTPDRDFASESWNRRELCRAAPAGGDVAACARKLLAEVMHADALGDLPDQVHGSTMFALAQALDSAPAGSGEVEALVQKWRDESESGFDGDGNLSDTWTAQAKRACADELSALLRKLQQGAVDMDYKLPCDVRVAPATTITKGCKLGTLIECIKLREEWAASQGQEGDHARD